MEHIERSHVFYHTYVGLYLEYADVLIQIYSFIICYTSKLLDHFSVMFTAGLWVLNVKFPGNFRKTSSNPFQS